jgi:hypothetical protein
MTSKKAGKALAPPVVATPAEYWKHDPDDHDYPAARSFLSLLATADEAERFADELSKAPIELHPAKDVLRAADLELLPMDDASVMRDLGKVIQGDKLSPVLLLRGDIHQGIRAVIADGYHRVCASYHLSENELIPCRLIDYPGTATKHKGQK